MGESYYLEEKGRYSTVDKCKEIIISISASPLVLYSLSFFRGDCPSNLIGTLLWVRLATGPPQLPSARHQNRPTAFSP